MGSWEPRPVRSDEVDEFRARVSQGFGHDLSDDEEGRERFEAVFDLDRTVAVFDGETLVGTGAAFTFDLTIPGGVVPMGGTTVITVRPTHRRQGILKSMMDHHLDEVTGRGEPLAGLWASEAAIYGRFGYGIASEAMDATIDAGRIHIPDVEGDPAADLVELDVASSHIRTVYDRLDVPGKFSRTEEWWSNRPLGPDKPSDGYSKRRYAIVIEDGEPVGYAIYRQKLDWSGGGPNGEVRIVELVSTTAPGRRALWRLLTNIDLFEKVTWWNMPIDEPLGAMVADPRQVGGKPGDALWIRLLDIESSIAARAYETDDTITVSLSDPFRPANTGTYTIEVSGGEAKCTRTEADSDVSCDVDVLGHLYLGGGNALKMAGAGRLEGSDEAVHRLHRLFRTDVAPWCPEIF